LKIIFVRYRNILPAYHANLILLNLVLPFPFVFRGVRVIFFSKKHCIPYD